MAYWMVSNRKVVGSGTQRSLGTTEGELTYWTADAGDLTKLSAWTERSARAFRERLVRAAHRFPKIVDPADQESQKHVTLFIHGFNNSWKDAVARYRQIADDMYAGDAGLGECVVFSWPSDGLKTAYYPDRLEARRSADDLATVLTDLYDHLVAQQDLTMAKGRPTCWAKVSVIAHSMGNFVLQKGLQHVWTRRNQPLLLSLINQLVMVAADVDNDLFKGGEDVDRSDGDAVANLCYRITALYTGLDAVLGVSAGLKHFGKRRLGRSGLDRRYAVPDNVWDIDCTPFLKDVPDTHSAYFDVEHVRKLMTAILKGVDRRVLADEAGLIKTAAVPVEPVA